MSVTTDLTEQKNLTPGEGRHDDNLQEWTTAIGNAEAAVLAQLSHGTFCAACPVAGEAGLGIACKDDHEKEIFQADGESLEKEIINEIATTPKAPSEGFWLRGNKYKVTHTVKNEESGLTAGTHSVHVDLATDNKGKTSKRERSASTTPLRVST